VKAAVVVTTIHDCSVLLDGYLRNFAKFGREATIFLIPDRKTPAFNIPKGVLCPELTTQFDFLNDSGFRSHDIPENSDNRRNVGYLMALADGAEMVVSIDDDNYCPEDRDFIGEHYAGLSEDSKDGFVSVDCGWYNNLNTLGMGDSFYPRGFPYYAKNDKRDRRIFRGSIPVRINAGMWKGDLDLDAITWLAGKSYTPDTLYGSISLYNDTWCPINSQNTAVHRDLMGAYYFVRMTSMMDRFGDIFQGYFALKVAKHMGWTARFGSPVVTHHRNSHVYLKDVQKEIEPILLLEELLPKLLETKLTGTTVEEAYLSLSDFVESQASPFYSETARLMRMWSQAVKRIG
jgi:Reversibly glycosylated polypeptide